MYVAIIICINTFMPFLLGVDNNGGRKVPRASLSHKLSLSLYLNPSFSSSFAGWKKSFFLNAAENRGAAVCVPASESQRRMGSDEGKCVRDKLLPGTFYQLFLFIDLIFCLTYNIY
jgi:hypothetical protein